MLFCGLCLGEMLIGQRSVCGVLMVLAGMLKYGKRDDLNDFGNVLISLFSYHGHLTLFCCPVLSWTIECIIKTLIFMFLV